MHVICGRIAASLLFCAALGVQATTYTWNGSASTLWSNPANWTPNGVPASGDSLVFPSSAAAVVTNNLAAGSVFSIAAAGDYEIHGNEIVSSSIDAPGVRMHAPLRLAGNATYRLYRAAGGIDVGAHALTMGTREIGGPLAGTGSITFGPLDPLHPLGIDIEGAHSFSGLVTAGPVTVMGAVLPATMQVEELSAVNAPSAVGEVHVTERLGLDFNLATGNFVLDGDFAFATEGGKVVVTGTVTLGAGSGLTYRTSVPTPGTVYTLVENDGTDPVSGTFAGLPEGSAVTLGIYHYWVSYVGGDGNDVTLTATFEAVDSDFDFDGKSDLLWYHQGDGTLYRMSMDGAAIKNQEGVYREPNLDWQVVGDGDFNGDGVADVLWRNAATGDVYVMLFGTNGRPAGGAVVYREADPQWHIVAARDLNRDGKADILWWNAATGRVYSMLMSGTTIVHQGFIHQFADLGWRFAGVAVLERPARLDHGTVVWRHATTGEVAMTFTDYLFTWNSSQVPVLTEPNLAWKIVGTADLQGDGTTDLLWFNETTGELYGMKMNGTQVAGGAVIHVAGAGWKPAAIGDYDGDGMADVAWRNEIDGRVHVMLIDGSSLTVKSQATVHVEANPDWKLLGGRAH